MAAAPPPPAEAKWVGKPTAELKGVTADQVWPLLADYCALHKWLPLIDNCEHVGGPSGEVGEVRRVFMPAPPSDGAAVKLWADEELLAVDPAGRSLTYTIIANNMGHTAYTATMKVLETEGGDAEKGCVLEWSYACNPLEGYTDETFFGLIESGAKGMVKKIKDALLAKI